MISSHFLERELGEETLKANTLIFESIIERISVSDEDGIIFYTNPAEDKMFGQMRDELMARQLIHQNPCSSEGTARISEEIDEQLQVRGYWEAELINQEEDGTLLNKFVRITAFEYAGKRYWLRVQEDITERKQAEVAQAYLAAIVESFNDAIIGKTLQGIITSWNKGAEKLYGYTASEIIGQSINTLVPPDRQEEEEDILEKLRRGEQIDRFETVRLRKGGTPVDVSITASPIKDRNGRIVGASKIIRDISERMRFKDALRRSEAKFRRLLENLPAAAYTCDAEGVITYYNPQAVQLWGRAPKLNDSEERFCGSFKLFSTEGVPISHNQSGMAMALRDGKEYNGHEIVIERPDGSRLTALAHINPIHDDSDNLVGAVNVLIDISDRKRAEKEKEELLKREKEACAKAQAANRSKDEFISLVSHELRSPLNSILGYSLILRSNPHDAARVSQTCDIIERNARVQLRLIEDLLDTARVISGKLRLDRCPTDIVLVLANALDVVRPVAEAKGIKLRVRYSLKTEMINGDSVRLQQVIGNLLSNAIKFTSEGGRVELSLERNDKDLCIIVSDTGKGIDPEFLPHIFDRFRQNDSSSSCRHGGLGLGLALAKQLIELHGGTIEAASEGIDLGSTFTIRLPPAVQCGLFETEPPALRTESAIELPDTATIEGVRVLVVDDRQEARAALADFLSKYGAIVTAVASGAEAMAILADRLNGERPDVFICDISMPDEDGYVVMKHVRALERERGVEWSHRIPAIALTAMASREDWVRALSAGFNIHVAKPVEPAELVMMVASLATNQYSRKVRLDGHPS
jgi:PAS domain S-box-containing protein